MLAFIGGTGPEGLGLAYRLALAGEEIIIGSRVLERAQDAAAKILAKAPQAKVDGAENLEAVSRGDIIFVTVPFAAHNDTLLSLKDAIGAKLVVDVVVPLAFEKGVARALLVAEGSVAEQAQAILTQATVVSAFHNVDASELFASDSSLDQDVVVCGNDTEAKKLVMALAEKIRGVRAINGGGLANSRYVEDLTALLLNINRIYKAHTGIRITGI